MKPNFPVSRMVLVLLILSGFLIAKTWTAGTPASLDDGLAHAQVKTIDKKDDKTGLPTKGGDPSEDKTGKETPSGKVKLPDQASAVNPEAFRMIEMIESKNRELKKREEELVAKEQQLKTLEQKISADLQKIDNALTKSQEQLGLQKELVKENIDSLIKVYSTMKPEEAATLLEAIDENLALQIISGMKSKIAGQVLSRLDVKVAKNISEKLAGKVKGDQ